MDFEHSLPVPHNPLPLLKSPLLPHIALFDFYAHGVCIQYDVPVTSRIHKCVLSLSQAYLYQLIFIIDSCIHFPTNDITSFIFMTENKYHWVQAPLTLFPVVRHLGSHQVFRYWSKAHVACTLELCSVEGHKHVHAFLTIFMV